LAERSRPFFIHNDEELRKQSFDIEVRMAGGIFKRDCMNVKESSMRETSLLWNNTLWVIGAVNVNYYMIIIVAVSSRR
jgi:hypothetical protein